MLSPAIPVPQARANRLQIVFERSPPVRQVASNQDEFKSHVRRILDSKGGVTLLMLDPSSPQNGAPTSSDLGGLHRQDPHKPCAPCRAMRRARAVRVGAAHDLRSEGRPNAFPYMVAGNEQRLVTASYLGSTDSDQVTSLEFERSCDAAKAAPASRGRGLYSTSPTSSNAVAARM